MDEFDANFRRSLKRTITSDRLPIGICEALQLDNQSRIIKSCAIRKLLYRFSRSSFGWLCDFMRVNLLANSPNNATRLTFKQKLHRLWNDQTRKSAKWWPTILLLVYLISIIKISFNAYFQYIYDANRFKLAKLREHLSDERERHRLEQDLQLDVDQLVIDFTSKAREAYRNLKLIGSSFVHWSFISEAIILLSIHNVYWILKFPLIHHLGDHVWLSARTLLDRNNERQARFMITLDELQRFTLESLTFSRLKMEQYMLDLANAFEGQETLVGKDHLEKLKDSCSSERRKTLNQRHQRTIEQLKMIALEGRLNPLHRTRSSRDKMALAYLVVFVYSAVYFHVFLVMTHYSLRWHFESQREKIEFRSLADRLSSVLFLVLSECNIISTMFNFCTLTITVYDQLEATRHLRNLIINTIRRNKQRSRQIVHSSEWSYHIRFHHKASQIWCRGSSFGATVIQARDCSELARQMELDLLTVIMHCRLIRSFELVKYPLGQIASYTFYYAISVPIVFCAHSAYLSSGIKMITLFISLASAVSCLSFLASLGLLYRRSVKAFETIWTLVAQLTYFETVPSLNEHLMFDSSVTLTYLRRMLTDSHITMDRFSIKAMGMKITYANLARTLAWTMVLTVASSITMRLFGEGLGTIMSDPFNLFKFLKVNSAI